LTGLLLLPVAAILVWLYWFLLPGRKWMAVDSTILMLVFVLASVFLQYLGGLDFESSGPLWPYIVSATGSYGILLIGLALALFWRRHRAKRMPD
jgi:hypothetical protein